MSKRDRHRRHHNHERNEGDRRRGGGPNTHFMDLEISRLMAGRSQQAARQALHGLLVEAARAELSARFGHEIEELAKLAVDDLLNDLEDNLAIEELLSERRARGKAKDERLRAIFANEREPASDDLDDDDE